ncbi:lamin tail domain-containing protein 1 isoform X9 [Pongo abelii]|uniref:lamin tail domain-containing protein 1 isoform X9 n=1 Tax=Pongo abelii TaxID=9601 RepID=UPI0023E75D01|nr:lamin tail domain-containing protein 1 isoform X11 [Pongo abelii]XP_054382971.1 lamin tail domain-containing protein 1 isoform X11 [Pongo abelii]XP_054382972.1 lamin tail domain-containing protein 1 isoform X11 [Pongo abelii]XP_054382973.1 lamin tail domain-containing protein 1 isoform X11 [Pongo abelii]
MKDTQDIQEASEAMQNKVREEEDKNEKQKQREDKLGVYSLVHFSPKMLGSVATTLPLSSSNSSGMPLGYYLSSPQISRVTISTTGQLISKATVGSCSRVENSLDASLFSVPKKQDESPMIGDGEDYFLSLFGDSKKLIAHSNYTQKTLKYFSMILEEVGQFTSSSLGDVEIAEVNVKGLFVKLINSSLDKEMAIGDHILQQNVNGQTISLYRFLPNMVMQANSTVTAIAWYTPIHWKQAWEKLDTDIEFNRCSVVSPTFRKHVFQWTASTTTITKEKQDQPKKDISNYQVEQAQVLLKREKEIPPTVFPNRSPWCQNPYVSAHPYCPLIEPHNISTAGGSLDRQPRSRSTRPNRASGTKKKKTSESQKQ